MIVVAFMRYLTKTHHDRGGGWRSSSAEGSPATTPFGACSCRVVKTISVSLPEGTKMVMPGDNTKMTIEMITPVALEEQQRFAIREGGRTVGAGIVTKILA